MEGIIYLTNKRNYSTLFYPSNSQVFVHSPYAYKINECSKHQESLYQHITNGKTVSFRVSFKRQVTSGTVWPVRTVARHNRSTIRTTRKTNWVQSQACLMIMNLWWRRSSHLPWWTRCPLSSALSLASLRQMTNCQHPSLRRWCSAADCHLSSSADWVEPAAALTKYSCCLTDCLLNFRH